MEESGWGAVPTLDYSALLRSRRTQILRWATTRIPHTDDDSHLTPRPAPLLRSDSLVLVLIQAATPICCIVWRPLLSEDTHHRLSMKRIFGKLRRRLRHEPKPATQPPSSAKATPAKTAPAKAAPDAVASEMSVTTPESTTEALPPFSSRAPDGQADAPLESLPAEVRHHLLSFLDLGQLKRLVHASPVYHQQYLSGRRLLLCGLLEGMLGIAAVDAWAACRASVRRAAGRLTRGKVKGHLQRYQERRSSIQTYSIRDENLPEKDLVFMVKFHWFVVAPLARRYTHWALSNLRDESTVEFDDDETLSQTEEGRLIRALYRFQLCCTLFGNSHLGAPQVTGSRFESVEILVFFLCLFEPWEVEEIACIYAFAKEKYGQVFGDIKWDVDQTNPKFDGQRPPTPNGAFDFDNPWAYTTLLRGTISRGLDLLQAVFGIDDHDQLVSAMQAQITWAVGNFLEDDAWSESTQFVRRRGRPSEGDEKQQRKDPMPFEGDSESCPPLAWTTIWKDTYSNLFGIFMPEATRLLGYVFWDAPRMESTGACDVVTRQRETDWRGYDPRDYLLY
ncbi:Uncharacterized protein TPAR_02102 [Tolypocladium paradoxum]|uniref:F-box domain-containing protein n=1 Tax=Tolypocladium paradoxum TaxID=94208 RepID=A0A2S4L5M8_9HYPO|nr:Uncharacterized protein TPAR_02102 [Tolypocladium paradoxum]